MRITISFPRELTLAAFSSIAQYSDILEPQLTSAADAEKESIRRRINNMHLDEEKALEEWSLATQEHDTTFNMVLPNFFRYSFIVLLCLIVENKLRELAGVMHRDRPALPAPPDPRQDIIAEYKTYFATQANITGPNWEKLLELNKVRNCIVHASGKVEGFRHSEFLVQLARRGIGLHISGSDYDHRRQPYPLYLEDGMLVLEARYCKNAALEVRGFFAALCDDIGLRPMMIE